MAGLRLGPLLRQVDWKTGESATVWVETDRACVAEVVCDDGARGSARTWQVAGHHYALVQVEGLRPGNEVAYRVLLDGDRVWPLDAPPDGTGALPVSTIRTPLPGAGDEVRLAFGSCRWAAPPSGAGTRLSSRAHVHDPIGPDALDTLAHQLATDPSAQRPDVLLLLGDQVYADETSDSTRAWLATRRDLEQPPGSQVADFEEYAHLYYESWLDPEVRWLLSSVPSCMIFDDHDVIDDWNTSETWLDDMRRTGWWHERITAGLMSYWVYQHLGNLSPAELAADALYADVAGSADGTALLREFAERADAEPGSMRWSYRRDFGRTRVLMVDSRAARVLPEQERAMLDATSAAWLREQALSEPESRDHLLIGTSLPWLLPPAIHDAEQWNAALCAGRRGERWARIGEKIRQAGDLEHWAAFPRSFDDLTELVARVGSGPHAPAGVFVLSGDVHHAYVAEPRWRGTARPQARVLQLTCSPVHNSVPATMKAGFRFGWSRFGRWVGRALARHGRVSPPEIDWRRTGGPWFGNQLMTLTLSGRRARLRLDRADREGAGTARLGTVFEADVT